LLNSWVSAPVIRAWSPGQAHNTKWGYFA